MAGKSVNLSLAGFSIVIGPAALIDIGDYISTKQAERGREQQRAVVSEDATI
jgi:hypothetical protein